MPAQNALLTILIEKIRTDTLVLPSLPEIALKIRKMADDPDVNLAKMSDMISHDPALSARIMKIANSAFVGRGVHVHSLQQATTRIGLRYIKNVVTAMAMATVMVVTAATTKEVVTATVMVMSILSVLAPILAVSIRRASCWTTPA